MKKYRTFEERFGRGTCPVCGNRFIRHSSHQRYCGGTCAQAARNTRKRPLSDDPRFAHRRARTRAKAEMTGSSGAPVQLPKFTNESKALRGPKIASSGLQGPHFVLAIELAAIPVVWPPLTYREAAE